MGCSPLCAAMTPAHKAGDMPTAHECVLCIVLLLSDLCCATSYLENMGNRDHCTAFTLRYGRKEPLSRGFLPPFLQRVMVSGLTHHLLALQTSSSVSKSSGASQDCHTVMRARHQNRKSIVCKQSPPTCAFENLPHNLSHQH